jgi:cell division protein FtsB
VLKKQLANVASNVTIIFQARRPMKASLARFGYLIALFVVMSYALIALHSSKGFHSYSEKQAQITALEKRNAELARQIEEKRRYLERLKDNPGVQDLEIQKEYKLVHPRDKVYMLPKQPAVPPNPARH